MSDEVQKNEGVEDPKHHTSCYSEWYWYDGPVSKIRLTVWHDSSVKLFHPLALIAAAKEWIRREEESYLRTSNAYGPYEGPELFPQKSV